MTRLPRPSGRPRNVPPCTAPNGSDRRKATGCRSDVPGRGAHALFLGHDMHSPRRPRLGSLPLRSTGPRCLATPLPRAPWRGTRPIRTKLVLPGQVRYGLGRWYGLIRTRGGIRTGVVLRKRRWYGWYGWGGAVPVPRVGEGVSGVALGLPDGEPDGGRGDAEFAEQVAESLAGEADWPEPCLLLPRR